MTKRKKWIPTRFTGLTYTGGIRPLPAPRRKRERTESEPRKNKEKADQGVSSTQSGKADPMNHQ